MKNSNINKFLKQGVNVNSIISKTPSNRKTGGENVFAGWSTLQILMTYGTEGGG